MATSKRGDVLTGLPVDGGEVATDVDATLRGPDHDALGIEGVVERATGLPVVMS